MKIGWAYMSLAAILVVLGVGLSVSGWETLGLIVVSSSLVFIYIGSNSLADARKEREGDAAADSTK